MSLSERIRPGCEAAPWVCDEVQNLEATNAELCDKVQNFEAMKAELLEALESVVAIAKEAHVHWDADRDSRVGKILLALAGANEAYDNRIDWIHAAIAKAKGEQL